MHKIKGAAYMHTYIHTHTPNARMVRRGVAKRLKAIEASTGIRGIVKHSDTSGGMVGTCFQPFQWLVVSASRVKSPKQLALRGRQERHRYVAARTLLACAC